MTNESRRACELAGNYRAPTQDRETLAAGFKATAAEGARLRAATTYSDPAEACVRQEENDHTNDPNEPRPARVLVAVDYNVWRGGSGSTRVFLDELPEWIEEKVAQGDHVMITEIRRI